VKLHDLRLKKKLGDHPNMQMTWASILKIVLRDSFCIEALRKPTRIGSVEYQNNYSVVLVEGETTFNFSDTDILVVPNQYFITKMR
jgi:hypothetical protein